MKYVLFILIVWLGLIPTPARAHNGALAVAMPIGDIAIDGDLSDWPEGMQRHAIALPEFGVRPQGEEDLQADFRLAYDADQQALYIAVEVRDESVVVLDKGGRGKIRTAVIFISTGHTKMKNHQ